MNQLLTTLGISEAAFWTIAVGVVANASCAILGCYLVLRRMSLLGDAISHSVLPGIALAFMFAGRESLAMFAGAMAAGLLTALFTQSLHALGKVPEDASMGAVFTSMFAIGVILITNVAPRVDLDPGCVLYGLIEFAPLNTVEIGRIEVPSVLPTLSLALAVTLLLVALFWKEFKIVSFDPDLATAMGISALFFHYLLMTMVAGVTVAAFEAVGSILVIAMLIVPAAAAHLLTDRLGWMMVWSVAIGAVSAVAGYAFDRTFQTGVAPMMAVAAGGQFALAVVFSPRYGVLSKAWHNLALAVRIAGEDILATLYRREESLSRAVGGAEVAEMTTSQATRGNFWARLALPRLWRRGDVRIHAGGRLTLTQQGKELAQSLVRSHRLWEAYLGEHFQLPLDHLHEPAERIEHFIGPDLQAQLAAELQSPRDPHGREIPPDKPAE
jgi:ABC-type Mn2+/Zn2+ transport system permease subunit/Mn-dependent DtxR family transcriptional regulator